MVNISLNKYYRRRVIINVFKDATMSVKISVAVFNNCNHGEIKKAPRCSGEERKKMALRTMADGVQNVSNENLSQNRRNNEADIKADSIK